MRFRVQVRGFDRLRDDIVDGQADADREFRQVVSRGALNVKMDWARRWTGIGHLPHIARAISYDIAGGSGRWSAEIGPDKLRRQGPLGTIIEDAHGLARNRATHAGNRAGRAEEPRFVRAVADAAQDAVGG